MCVCVYIYMHSHTHDIYRFNYLRTSLWNLLICVGGCMADSLFFPSPSSAISVACVLYIYIKSVCVFLWFTYFNPVPIRWGISYDVTHWSIAWLLSAGLGVWDALKCSVIWQCWQWHWNWSFWVNSSWLQWVLGTCDWIGLICYIYKAKALLGMADRI